MVPTIVLKPYFPSKSGFQFNHLIGKQKKSVSLGFSLNGVKMSRSVLFWLGKEVELSGWVMFCKV